MTRNIQFTSGWLKEYKCQPVKIVYSVKHLGDGFKILPVELYDTLKKKYNQLSRDGLTIFEYFDTTINYVKPHIDYEEYMTIDDYNTALEENIKNKVLDVLTEIFESPNWAISSDTRIVERKKMITKKKFILEKQWKISYHYVLYSKKCKISILRKFMEQNLHKFKEKNLNGIDLAIYRLGINKFRTPMSKKSQTDKKSLMVACNFKTRDDFAKHLVSYIEKSKKIHLKIIKVKNKTNTITPLEYAEITQNDIEKIISRYNIISTSQGNSKNCIFYNISNNICGMNHDNNHNVLIHNLKLKSLKIHCHSGKCNGFEKILYIKPVPTTHFSTIYMNTIPLLTDSTNNYKECKEYFENFFIFIRDTNSFFRKRFSKGRKFDNYAMELRPANINGYCKNLYYKELQVDEEKSVEIYKNFYKRFEKDAFRKTYLGIKFEPIGVKQNYIEKDGEYNTFNGFGYLNILTQAETLSIPNNKYKDFKFLINHIKQYICGYSTAKDSKDEELAIQLFDYLLQFLKNFIEKPKFVPQILLIFFSTLHGTGKSGFTKFISRLIGTNYSHFLSLEELQEKHSNSHVSKLLNVIEETDRKVTYKAKNFIKNITQREKALYNEKNQSILNIETYVRYITTTNFYDGVYMDPDARRFVVYTFEKITKNQKYIDKLEEILEDPYIVYLFGKYLENEVVEKYHTVNEWRNNRPLTANYYRMRSGDIAGQFLTDFLNRDENVILMERNYSVGKPKNTIVISKIALYESYKFYCQNNNNGKNKGSIQFYNYINAHFPETIKEFNTNKTGRNRLVKFGRSACYSIYLKKLSKILQPLVKFKNFFTENED